jgi:hypothetical protein
MRTPGRCARLTATAASSSRNPAARPPTRPGRDHRVPAGRSAMTGAPSQAVSPGGGASRRQGQTPRPPLRAADRPADACRSRPHDPPMRRKVCRSMLTRPLGPGQGQLRGASDARNSTTGGFGSERVPAFLQPTPLTCDNVPRSDPISHRSPRHRPHPGETARRALADRAGTARVWAVAGSAKRPGPGSPHRDDAASSCMAVQ